ncbi:MAG: DUF6756 family protein [Pleurocapsa sp.]
MSLRYNIEEAKKELRISDESFKEVKYYSYESILKQIGEKFTNSGKRATQYFRINHDLKGDVVSFMPKNEEDVPEILKLIIPDNSKLWFIGAETKNEKPKYWLYESDLDSAIAIICNMYLFDFYLVDKKYNWLISEEHHGVLVSVGEPVASNLKHYKKHYLKLKEI